MREVEPFFGEGGLLTDLLGEARGFGEGGLEVAVLGLGVEGATPNAFPADALAGVLVAAFPGDFGGTLGEDGDLPGAGFTAGKGLWDSNGGRDDKIG